MKCNHLSKSFSATLIDTTRHDNWVLSPSNGAWFIFFLYQDYWTRFQITMINWKWQVMFYVMVIFIIWTTDYYFMALYLTIQHIKDIILLIR